MIEKSETVKMWAINYASLNYPWPRDPTQVELTIGGMIKLEDAKRVMERCGSELRLSITRTQPPCTCVVNCKNPCDGSCGCPYHNFE